MLLAMATPLLGGCGGAGTEPLAQRCGGLAGKQLAGVDVESSRYLEAAAGTAAHCELIGRSTENPAVGIKLALPHQEHWNGKLFFRGGGGLDGVFPPLLGSAGFFAGHALNKGYVVAATDSGHKAGPAGVFDATWALNAPDKEDLFGFAAVDISVRAAKRLSEALYGSRPKRSYFMGCSNGGRQALMQAGRYPENFDGIVSVAPVWDALAGVLPRYATLQQRQADSSSALTSANADLLQAEVLRQCDTLDGAADGLVVAAGQCNAIFQRSTLACGNNNGAPGCFAAGQMETLGWLLDGPRTGPGQVVSAGFPVSGAEASPAALATWMIGGPGAPSGQRLFADGLSKYLAFRPDDITYGFDRYSVDTDIGRSATMRAILDAPTDVNAFLRRGGKLLMASGWSDYAVSARSTIEYHDKARANAGPLASNISLFLAPGVQHCAGGPGPDSVDLLTPLEQWVEASQAPAQVIANALSPQGEVTRSLPLCAYPKVARFNGSGAVDSAANWSCR
jgi:feruloyl esterase